MNDNKLNKIMPLLLVFGVIGYLVAKNWEVASNIIIALLGFGMLVFVHELGHFLAARKNDVECEAFAIGMAIGTPFLLGVKKIATGWRVRVLPKTSGVKDEFAEQDCLLMFNIGNKAGAGDTEYCLGPLPIGGFVKMVGQDDSGPVDTSTDTNPRSFANKSVGARMMITSAGVLANIFTAFIIFLGLAFYGIERVPAIIGDVLPGYPAAEAGLEAGDEIIKIDGKSRLVGGKSNLDFTHLALAPMLGKRGEAIDMTVKRTDGSIAQLSLTPAQLPGGNYGFGIEKPSVLKLANISDPDGYYQELGLEPGDEVFAAGGEPVSSTNEFYNIVSKTYQQKIIVSAKRQTQNDGEFEAVSTELDLSFSPGKMVDGEIKLANINSLVPLLQIIGGFAVAAGSEEDPLTENKFAKGDIVIKIADIAYPNFLQFRDATQANADKEMLVEVLRKQPEGGRLNTTVKVIPRTNGDRAVVGVELNLFMEGNVVAGSDDSKIEAGAIITAINSKPVKSFYDIATAVSHSHGAIEVKYKIGDKTAETVIDRDYNQDANIVASLKLPVPFDDYRKLYKAQNTIEAFQMGGFLIMDMVDQAVLSIKALVLKRVSANEMSGPVGIARISYVIVQQKNFAFFLYFLGMISCFLAVFNFLPIPVVDGGLFMLLVIEKIKGSPVSFTVQKYLVYVGLALLGLLLLFVTFNDIFKIAKGLL